MRVGTAIATLCDEHLRLRTPFSLSMHQAVLAQCVGSTCEGEEGSANDNSKPFPSLLSLSLHSQQRPQSARHTHCNPTIVNS